MATFGTFTAGQVLTAAELNSAGAWSSYTPTWTQSAAITKTVNWARYTQLNKLVIVQIQMTATGAGTASNKILVGLPVNASANNFVMGVGYFQDGGTTGTGSPLIPIYDSTSAVAFLQSYNQEADPSTGQIGLSTSGLNITVASTDIIQVSLTYEAA